MLCFFFFCFDFIQTRSRAKTPKKAASQRHRKSRVHHETQPDLLSSSSSSTSAELPQVPSPPSRPAEPDVVIALECSEDTESVVSRIATEGVLTGCDPSATKVVSQSDLSPTAIALWKDILKKEVLLHELSKKAEAVMAVLNDQLEICRSLGVDVLSVDREIADLVEFKAINKK